MKPIKTSLKLRRPATTANKFAEELLHAWTLICETDRGPRTWHCPVSTEQSKANRFYRGVFRRMVNRINRYGSHPFADYLFASKGIGFVGDHFRNFDWKTSGVTP